MAKTKGLCEKHHKATVRAGINGHGPVEPVVKHVAQLRQLGWSAREVSEAAGVARSTVERLGQRDHLRNEVARKILALPLEERHNNKRGGTRNAIGFVRRLRALARAGYTTEYVGKRLGIGATTRNIAGQQFVSAFTDHAMRVLYAELKGWTGPSSRAAHIARRYGWETAAQWDERTIDNPLASAPLDEFGEVRYDSETVDKLVNGEPFDWTWTTADLHEAAKRLPWMTAKDLASHFDVGYHYVVRFRGAGKRVALDPRRIQELYAVGLSLEEVAQELKSTKKTVQRTMIKHGISRRPSASQRAMVLAATG